MFEEGWVGDGGVWEILLISYIMERIQILFNDNSAESLCIHDMPDTCPLCHHSIVPITQFAFCDREKRGSRNCLQIVFRCPKKDCKNLFIANYSSLDQHCNNFIFQYSRPVTRLRRDFTETIREISPSFCEIYNQSLVAEEEGLLEVCGGGYRKALEFLIKDYLIRNCSGCVDVIEKKSLGDCIVHDIKNENVKKIAKRATWLGNDEVHYLKKWEGKDLKDLKNLIDVTLYWIEMEKLTVDVEQEMPES